MPLLTGTRIGSYEIGSLIGVGGMGEVYRARDMTLGRDVAVKVLPDAFAGDPERMARFEREAKTLAALNHPHIAQIYGVDTSSGSPALVMELVEGPTLADLAATGPIPLDQALPIAEQIAGALEAAHEQGIIHRDLKPANVKVRADGTVKVLDFGLAKVFETSGEGSGESRVADALTNSPTIGAPANTIAGVILGTAAYMAPEQARGKPIDKRADVWAFGTVLYEMLAGERLFKGDDVSETLASVIKDEPRWDRVPARAQRLLKRCLQKDPRRRLRDIGDARMDILDLAADEEPGEAVTPRASYAASRVRWLGTGALLAVLVATALWYARATPRAPERPAHLSITLPAGVVLPNFGSLGAISADGTRMVFPGFDPKGRLQLFVRNLNDPNLAPLPGTDGGTYPFFSPDGEWVAFFDGARLKKVPLGGGSPIVVANVGGSCGAWADDGLIYFCPAFGTGLSSVPADGGEPRIVTRVDYENGELWHGMPSPLPGSRALLFTTYSVDKSFDEGNVSVVSLDTGERRVVLNGARNAQYLPSGHLVFGRSHDVFAVPFDAGSLRVTGQPIRLAEGVFATGRPAWVKFFASATGPLVYAAGNGNEDSLLVTRDRLGAVQAQTPMQGFVYSPASSPDGRHVAFQGPPDDIWVLQLDSKAMTRLTYEPGEHETPVWSPDGTRVAYASSRRGYPRAVFARAADGNGPEERFFVTDAHVHLSSWSADGRSIIFEQGDAATGWDVWIYRMGEGQPGPVVIGPADELHGALSPNGRYIAYDSNESGRAEVYVQPFPATGAKWQISTGGGGFPRWSPDGRELSFWQQDGQVLSLPVNTAGAFVKGTLRLTYRVPDDVMADLMTEVCSPAGAAGAACFKNQQAITRVDVKLNWLDELRARPGAR